jgi:hypothetical protein
MSIASPGEAASSLFTPALISAQLSDLKLLSFVVIFRFILSYPFNPRLFKIPQANYTQIAEEVKKVFRMIAIFSILLTRGRIASECKGAGSISLTRFRMTIKKPRDARLLFGLRTHKKDTTLKLITQMVHIDYILIFYFVKYFFYKERRNALTDDFAHEIVARSFGNISVRWECEKNKYLAQC